jgi:hypothetical protein
MSLVADLQLKGTLMMAWSFLFYGRAWEDVVTLEGENFGAKRVSGIYLNVNITIWENKWPDHSSGSLAAAHLFTRPPGETLNGKLTNAPIHFLIRRRRIRPACQLEGSLLPFFI